MPDEMLTTVQVAERLHVSRSYVYHLIREGGLPCVRVRHSILVRESVLEAWIEKQMKLFRLVLGGNEDDRGQGGRGRGL